MSVKDYVASCPECLGAVVLLWGGSPSCDIAKTVADAIRRGLLIDRVEHEEIKNLRLAHMEGCSLKPKRKKKIAELPFLPSTQATE